MLLCFTIHCSGCGSDDGTLKRSPDIARGPLTCGFQSNTAIADTGVGSVYIGALEQQVRRQCQVVRDTSRIDPDFAEIERFLGLLIGIDTVEALLDAKGGVMRIDVLSPGLVTDDSLHVGTLLRTLLLRPGVRGTVGEGRTFLSVKGHCGLALVLSESTGRETGDSLGPDDLGRLSMGASIGRISIYGCSSVK